MKNTKSLELTKEGKRKRQVDRQRGTELSELTELTEIDKERQRGRK